MARSRFWLGDDCQLALSPRPSSRNFCFVQSCSFEFKALPSVSGVRGQHSWRGYSVSSPYVCTPCAYSGSCRQRKEWPHFVFGFAPTFRLPHVTTAGIRLFSCSVGVGTSTCPSSACFVMSMLVLPDDIPEVFVSRAYPHLVLQLFGGPPDLVFIFHCISALDTALLMLMSNFPVSTLGSIVCLRNARACSDTCLAVLALRSFPVLL